MIRKSVRAFRGRFWAFWCKVGWVEVVLAGGVGLLILGLARNCFVVGRLNVLIYLDPLILMFCNLGPNLDSLV